MHGLRFDKGGQRSRWLILWMGVFCSITAGCQSMQHSGLGLTPQAPSPLDDSEVIIRYQDADEPIADEPIDTEPVLPDFEQTLQAESQRRVDRPTELVKEIRVTGNNKLPSHRILRNIRTRAGRYFDPDLLRQDIDQIWKMKEVGRVNGPTIQRTAEGVVVTIDIVERVHIGKIRFVGNRAITDWQLKRQLQLKEDEPLDDHEVRMARQQIEDYYRQEGFPQTQVTVANTSDTGEQDVVFIISEDQKERVLWVEFEGNQFASDARLRSFVKAKPTVMNSIKGFAIDRNEIEQDVIRLTTYYRTFGFFNARVGREIIESPTSDWVRLRFVIDEGPRYDVTGVSFIGNEKFATQDLAQLLELKPTDGTEPKFNSVAMKTDVKALRELYGSQGHVFADIEVEPRFLDEPGKIELVYLITEGKQYRVGKINVHIQGDAGITKREVILNRMELKPGEIISSREIDKSQRQLLSSQVFAGAAPGSGQPPRVAVNPKELQDLNRLAESESGMR